MLFVSRPTVYSMIRRGELRAIYIRHMVRLRPGVVTTYARMHQEWVARHKARAGRKRAAKPMNVMNPGSQPDETGAIRLGCYGAEPDVVRAGAEGRAGIRAAGAGHHRPLHVA